MPVFSSFKKGTVNLVHSSMVQVNYNNERKSIELSSLQSLSSTYFFDILNEGSLHLCFI